MVLLDDSSDRTTAVTVTTFTEGVDCTIRASRASIGDRRVRRRVYRTGHSSLECRTASREGGCPRSASAKIRGARRRGTSWLATGAGRHESRKDFGEARRRRKMLVEIRREEGR